MNLEDESENCLVAVRKAGGATAPRRARAIFQQKNMREWIADPKSKK